MGPSLVPLVPLVTGGWTVHLWWVVVTSVLAVVTGVAVTGRLFRPRPPGRPAP
jgi:hypothetical protein